MSTSIVLEVMAELACQGQGEDSMTGLVDGEALTWVDGSADLG
jgi:hypothetical protein